MLFTNVKKLKKKSGEGEGESGKFPSQGWTIGKETDFFSNQGFTLFLKDLMLVTLSKEKNFSNSSGWDLSRNTDVSRLIIIFYLFPICRSELFNL